VTPEEAKRLLTDWWGQCRTCKHWNSTNDRPNLGEFSCFAEASELHLRRTTSSGNCPEWDAFDVNVALEVMEESNK
jgi:predicted ATP-dependent serine protease